MVGQIDMEQREYVTLMDRCRDIERTSNISWIAAGATAVVLLSWAIRAENPGLMLPVIIAVALGFYALLNGRRNVRLISGYVEEFLEDPAGGPQWFTRLGRMRAIPGFNPGNDWLATAVANAIVVIATVFAWVYAGAASHGELMAGIETGFALIFAFHSIAETAKLSQTDFAAFWRQMSAGQQRSERPARAA